MWELLFAPYSSKNLVQQQIYSTSEKQKNVQPHKSGSHVLLLANSENASTVPRSLNIRSRLLEQIFKNVKVMQMRLWDHFGPPVLRVKWHLDQIHYWRNTVNLLPIWSQMDCHFTPTTHAILVQSGVSLSIFAQEFLACSVKSVRGVYLDRLLIDDTFVNRNVNRVSGRHKVVVVDDLNVQNVNAPSSGSGHPREFTIGHLSRKFRQFPVCSPFLPSQMAWF